MLGIGTLANVGAVLAGSAVGVSFGRFIPERVRTVALAAIGLAVIGLGLQMALDPRIDPSKFSYAGALPYHPNPLVIIGGLVGGSILGALLHIEARIEDLGRWAHAHLPGQQAGQEGGARFAEGFMTASLMYCVGAMAIIGSLQDAAGQPQVLYVKALLDGIGSIMLASALGAGVGLSALSIALYQGGITLGASVVMPWLSLPVMATLTASGGLLIAAIGFELCGFKRLQVGNMLPGVFLAAALARFFG